MSEIKVGEYVRTKKGFIAKVCAYQDLTTYDDKGISVTFHSFDTDKGEIADIEVAKYSSNIKELLGKDDYVNGYELQEFDDEEGNLSKAYTTDSTHVLGKYYADWVTWILNHAR